MIDTFQSPLLDSDRLIHIIQEADLNMMILNSAYEITLINPSLQAFFKCQHKINIQQGVNIIQLLERSNKRVAAEWEKRFDKALLGNKFKLEDAIKIEDQIYYWEFSFHSYLSHDNNLSIVVIIRDITLRKKYEGSLLKKEANLRSILNTVDDSVWLINRKYELIDFNQAFYEKYKAAFGVKLGIGKNIIDLIPAGHADLKQRWANRYESALKGKRGKYYDQYQIEDTVFTYEIITYPIKEQNKITGVSIYSRDISEQKDIENKLLAQNVELSKVNAELDRFVYSASHDLRAPLLSVKGLVNLIRMEKDNQNQHDYLNKIESAVNKLDCFIKDIIDFSMNSRTDLELSLIDFDEILKESVESLKYTSEAEQVRLERNLQPCHNFYSDPKRLLVVFNNIISNAVRYQDLYKEDRYLAITVECNSDKATIQFTDNGIGISKEYLEKIFGMFFRANNEKTGSGLGLYIVKETVETLKGTIKVDSVPNMGSQFIVEIPNLNS